MLRRKSTSTYSRHIGANGSTAKLKSLDFFLVVSGQVLLFQLLLSEKTEFHCPFCRIGFTFQQFFEPVDICLDDPSHIYSLRLYGEAVEAYLRYLQNIDEISSTCASFKQQPLM